MACIVRKSMHIIILYKQISLLKKEIRKFIAALPSQLCSTAACTMNKNWCPGNTSVVSFLIAVVKEIKYNWQVVLSKGEKEGKGYARIKGLEWRGELKRRGGKKMRYLRVQAMNSSLHNSRVCSLLYPQFTTVHHGPENTCRTRKSERRRRRRRRSHSTRIDWGWKALLPEVGKALRSHILTAVLNTWGTDNMR